MTPISPPTPTCSAGYVVLDLDLPDRPPLAAAEDYDAALGTLTALQEQFCDQLEANGEGGGRARLALTLAPVDATGTPGPPCYWAIVNGIRPGR